MSREKPQNIEEYKVWLKENYNIDVSLKNESHYKAVTTGMVRDFKISEFWKGLVKALPEYHDEYNSRTTYPLLVFRDREPIIETKPFGSFLLKTYRKNILENKNFPNEPQDGWLMPSNWYSKINDTIRTLLAVKYLDGVEFLIGKIETLCASFGTRCKSSLEAREEGYYAAHLYIKHQFEIPRTNWDTEKVEATVEIQITTQLQEVIRKLLHKYYEDRRQNFRDKGIDVMKWKWDYRSDEFSAAYLGHILHYVEGMIMDIRAKQKKEL
jgi:hypothetical protein